MTLKKYIPVSLPFLNPFDSLQNYSCTLIIAEPKTVLI